MRSAHTTSESGVVLAGVPGADTTQLAVARVCCRPSWGGGGGGRLTRPASGPGTGLLVQNSPETGWGCLTLPLTLGGPLLP